MKKKTIAYIIIGVIIAALLAFLIYWKATEHDRYIKKVMESFSVEISDWRAERSEWATFDFDFRDAWMEDPVFMDFLASQVTEMLDNGDYELLFAVLRRLEVKRVYNQRIQNVVTDWFESADDIENALELKETLDSGSYSALEYYNTNLIVNRNSNLLTTFINENGTEEITKTPGEGYYADEEDSSSMHTVGIEGSPLYDAGATTYRGDFKTIKSYGVKLNSYYEEVSYSETDYYFRGHYLDFSPFDGECVYSGDYLFCFSSNGTLIGCEKIEE